MRSLNLRPSAFCPSPLLSHCKQVFVAIAEGADLIGTELPKLLTSKGLAFTWNITPVGDTQSYVGHKRARDDDEDADANTSTPAARNPASTSTSTSTASKNETGIGSKFDNNHRSSSTGSTNATVSTFSSMIIPPTNRTGGEEGDDDVVDRAHHETPVEYLPAERSGYLVNLWDEKFRKDLTPLVRTYVRIYLLLRCRAFSVCRCFSVYLSLSVYLPVCVIVRDSPLTVWSTYVVYYYSTTVLLPLPILFRMHEHYY